MSFRSVFIAVTVAFALILSAFLVNRARPKVETEQPTADFVRASGKCAECHARLQYSVVHEYEMSAHAKKGVNCLDCHQPGRRPAEEGSPRLCDQRPSHCRQLPLLPRRHLSGVSAQPPRRAQLGRRPRREGLTPEQVAFSEQFQPGGTKRPPHPFVTAEGDPAMTSGCEQCHAVGKPNDDGTIGTCTDCHSRHTSSVALARLPYHLRPVPHGSRPLADRDLQRVQARRHVRRAAQPAQARCRSHDAHHARYVCAHLRHLPHERHQRPQGYAQSL